MSGLPRRSRSLGAKVTSGLHRMLYRLTGGRVGSRLGHMPMLLLTTAGRKSGQARTTPLTYLQEGDTYVIFASNTGKDWAPAWLGNLQTQPRATIQVGGTTIPVRASVAEPDERKWFWSEVVERYPNYAEYAHKTSREIPVIVLHPNRG